jgi:hypothetical protein
VRFLADESCDAVVVRELRAAVVRLVEQLGERLTRSFVVLEPGRIRIGSLPG